MQPKGDDYIVKSFIPFINTPTLHYPLQTKLHKLEEDVGKGDCGGTVVC